jgi:CcmD family protein
MIRKLLLSTFLFFINLFAFAQDTTKEVDMADTMRSNGKIYVVVAVILTIFVGLIIYLVRLDRKITRLEKEVS